MNNLLWLAPKLRGNPRFYAPPLFALLTSRLQKPELQKRTTVLFYYSGCFGWACRIYPRQGRLLRGRPRFAKLQDPVFQGTPTQGQQVADIVLVQTPGLFITLFGKAV